MTEAAARTTASALQLSIGLFKRRAREVGTSSELSVPEITVLSRLDRTGPSTTAELARWDRITPQAMGNTIAALEKRGLVTKNADPADGRRMIVTATKAGIDALRSGRDELTELITDALTDGFTPTELEQLEAASALIERLALRLER